MLYVSPTGNDSNDGSVFKPFASLGRAQEAVRKLKTTSSLQRPIAIEVGGGDYVQKTSLVFGPKDSGSVSAPIVWRAAPGQKVCITGGPILSANAFHAVTDRGILDRLDPSARGKVLALDLRPFGPIAATAYPQVFRGAPPVPELFFNDQRMAVAHWPNEGWATIAKIVESGSMRRDNKPPESSGVFEYSGDRPSRWNVDAGVWLQGYWCYDWYDETIKVKSVAADQHQITLAAPAVYGVKEGNPSPRRFRALNLLEELDQPGEYYIGEGILYFWPPAEITKSRVVLSLLNAPLFLLKDVEYVTIRGFIFEASLGHGIEISGGANDCIDHCTIRDTRQLGARITGGLNHRIENCDIYDTGGGGLALEGGDRKTLTPAHHEALNNHIWQYSRHLLTGSYAVALGGVGNRVAHNVIHDAPHQAIYIQGNDHLIEYNVIHDVVTETDDAGALYKGRNPSCRGNIIRYNLWRDIGSTRGHGTAAIYFDDGDGGDLVFGNVFLRCGDPGHGPFGTIFSHGGHGALAENNIFIDCKRALGSSPWGDKIWKEALEGGRGFQWQEKLLKEVDITKPPFTTHYPELVGYMTPEPGQPRNNLAKNNVLFKCGSVSNGNWKQDESEVWVTDTDPGFIDAATGNFQLRPDSEVFKRLPGFKPIPFEQIGFEHRRETGREKSH